MAAGGVAKVGVVIFGCENIIFGGGELGTGSHGFPDLGKRGGGGDGGEEREKSWLCWRDF